MTEAPNNGSEGILGIIVERKRAEVARRFGATPIEELRDRAEPTTRSLCTALARPGARFVMEVKRASPSGGAPRAVDPEVQARAYRGAADAISVLTDAPFFHGSLEDLGAVRRAFDGPILAKDFIVDLRQVAEARAHGADAVLAILAVLGPAGAQEVIDEARRLGMDVLVEAHSEQEVRQAVALGAPLIGLNNRNLKTLSVDLGVTERLGPLVPADRVLVSESGIRTRADIERLGAVADAFLVGTSLMQADDPAFAARQLAFGLVKICGLTDLADARAAARAGAAFAGIVFVPGTRRAVTRGQALPIAAEAKAAGMRTVGVFRNERVMEVALSARALDLDVIQLHGEEDLSYIRALRGLSERPVEIWAASSVERSRPALRGGADRTLFDTKVDGRCGGTGVSFDWSLLEGCAALPDSILAGGLSPRSARAAARLGAYGLDVCSGVEASPGRKHPEKMAAFLEALRPMSRREWASCA